MGEMLLGRKKIDEVIRKLKELEIKENALKELIKEYGIEYKSSN